MQYEDEIKESQETQSDLGEKRQDLVNTLAQTRANIDELKGEVAQMNVELKKAGEGRKAENLLFQNGISDQRATVHILTLALGKLKSFYNFAQTSSEQPGAPKTEDYSKSSGAGGVMQLIAKIISDAEQEGAELSVSEGDAQAAYAEFVRDTTDSIETANKAIAQKQKQKAEAKSEKSETQEAQTANKGEIEKLNKLP